MLVASDKLHLVTSDDRLARLFRQDKQFDFLRNPDGSLNKAVLNAQGMSSELFEQRLRQDMSSRQVMQGVEASVLAAATPANAGLDAFFQQRELQLERFDAAKYAAQVKPSDADLEAFYKDPKNAAQFQAPEQANIEYVVLDLDTLAKDVTLSEEDLKKYYTENESRYTTPEERRASHILIKAEKSATDEARAKAKARAEALLVEARKNPAGFAELARKNSEDAGSAQNGGEPRLLRPRRDGQTLRGRRVQAREKARSANVVTSDFGYHIMPADSAPAAAEKAQLRECARHDRGTGAQAAGAEEVQRDRGRVQQHGLRTGRRAEAGGREVQAAAAHGTRCDAHAEIAHRPARLAGSSSRRSSATMRSATSATPMRSRTAPNTMVSGRIVQYSPAPCAAAGGRARPGARPGQREAGSRPWPARKVRPAWPR